MRLTRRFRIGLRAFTVLELMVAVSAMALIVYVLFKVFDQTQRAMRSNAAQVDVMEGGRAAFDLLLRDMSQMAAAGVFSNVNFYAWPTSAEIYQHLLEDGERRTNVLEEIYFVSPSNQLFWITAYRILNDTNLVRPDGSILKQPYVATAADGYGRLARLSFPVHRLKLAHPNPTNRFDPFGLVMNPSPTNLIYYQHVLDGVVHFKVTAFDSEGMPMPSPYRFANYRDAFAAGGTNTVATFYRFTNNAVPASLELELGVLEPQVIDQLKALPPGVARARYLSNAANRVQLFTQRFPVRTASTIKPL